MDNTKKLKEVIKNCGFVDHRKFCNQNIFVCLLINPIIGSGVQCPLLINTFYEMKEEIPEKCPCKRITEILSL